MSLRSLISVFAALGVALLIGSSALAQPRNFNNAMQRPVKVKPVGTFVMAAGPNQFQMATNANQAVMVMVGPNTEVSVTGTAEQDYLKSGVNVEFLAEVDAKHMVKDKISHLLVISPNSDRPNGLLPPESATPQKKGGKAGEDNPKPLAPDAGIGGDAPAKPHKPHASADADSQGGDLFGGKPAKTKKTTPQFPGTFTVRGTVKMCKNGAITVSAGRGPTIKAELEKDVTIDVDMADLRVAQRDDKVTVSGVTNQANPNMVMAESVKIELVNPLTGAKKHATRAAKTPAAPSGKAKKGASDADDLLGGGK